MFVIFTTFYFKTTLKDHILRTESISKVFESSQYSSVISQGEPTEEYWLLSKTFDIESSQYSSVISQGEPFHVEFRVLFLVTPVQWGKLCKHDWFTLQTHEKRPPPTKYILADPPVWMTVHTCNSFAHFWQKEVL